MSVQVLSRPANGDGVEADDGSDELYIEMLGAGQEVGRSCCVMRYRGKTVVCDAGVHPAFQGIAALPFIDGLDWSTVDALLITHFHLDHAAALTYIMEKTNFREGNAKVYMTHPTKAVYRFLMSDFVRISNAGNADDLFSESEMLASWRSIEAVDYHQEVPIAGGLSFTSYHAGHVLGAAMFLIDIAGLKILYTGDFSREEDRHLVQAEVPSQRPDVLISESTYGVQSLEPRLDKERRFTTMVHNILSRGGRVLLPVFVLGRAQELLLLLDEYWAANPSLHSIPIYYASSLARKCISIYQTYIHTMNEHIRSRFNRRDNPFVFKHVSNLRGLDRFEDKGPCVMMASPGFMQSGVSRELLERWAPDRRNGLIVTGYSVEGTMARNILLDPDEIVSMAGQKIPLRMSVEEISFSAHVDFTQNSRFIDEVKAKHIVLVHGEQNNMSRLRAALQSKFAERSEDVKIHTPRNCEPLRLRFRGERMAKAIGRIAAEQPKNNTQLSGLLVAKDYAYTLLDPADLADFTGLHTSCITQRARLNLAVGWDLIRWHLEGMYGQLQEGQDLEGKRTLRVMGAVDIKQDNRPGEIVLEWKGSASNDMVADSAVALLLGVDSSPASVRLTTHPHSHSHDEKSHAESAEEVLLLERTEEVASYLDGYFGDVEETFVGGDEDEKMEVDQASAEPVVKEEVQEIKTDPDVPMTEEKGADAEATNVAQANGDAAAPPPTAPRAMQKDPIDDLRGPRRAALMVRVDNDRAVVEIDTLTVTSRSTTLKQRVEKLVSMAVRANLSISDYHITAPALDTQLFLGQHVQPLEPGSKEALESIGPRPGAVEAAMA
ncbi:Metallo-hydrolase/oxidoreductase [Ceraceosorus guamensis]|uniref:Endoribonuclease YSH1 n=1 Tax=Ceraceosorus guamensis TaxID=1522189 RepID=A0A316VTJ3_9BASI|nr:Metallo-hydrolase/oxidoreductase [Ceraceosorus guamensis]PWN39753.1 Metallo-hydrolase/oxidoreductase [Ceraceosorus guamensis]